MRSDGGGDVAKQENGYRANIGSSSLILIFIVMCLVTFGMLSLTSAKNNLNLAERNADAVKEYYRADREGEAFYGMVADAVTAACSRTEVAAEREKLLKASLGGYYQDDGKIAAMETAMKRAQALHVELRPVLTGEGSVKVAEWKVIQTEDYEIDNTLPVWTGNGD